LTLWTRDGAAAPSEAGQPVAGKRCSPTRRSPGGVEPQQTGNRKLAATVDPTSKPLEAQREPRTFGFPTVGGRRNEKRHEVEDGAGDSVVLGGTGCP
jgi:hypothetical protein